MMKRPKQERSRNVLGLAIGDDRFHAVGASRAKGVVVAGKPVNAALSVDPAKPDAVSVGRQIRQHLDAAGIRERTCVVALPAKWIMSQATRLPPGLSIEDRDSLLQIEAEKGFPCDPDELRIARSYGRSASAHYVTQFAVRHEHLEHLNAILVAAGLNPVSFTPGLASLPDVIPADGRGRISVITDTAGATLAIAAGGGLFACRSGESVDGTALTRELRITVEQIPPDLRSELRDVLLIGGKDSNGQPSSAIAAWARAAGLQLTASRPVETTVAEQMAAGAALNQLNNSGPVLEFLPPRPSRWALLLARYNSKRLATAAFATIGVLVVLSGLFAWQGYRLWSLGSRWRAMAAPVTALQNVQSQIREYRPWFDSSSIDLRILRALTDCFPDNGSVTAKSVEIRGASVVAISGTARDNPSLLRTLDQLRNVKSVTNLKVEQIRGKTPEQFTINFRWNDNSGL